MKDTGNDPTLLPPIVSFAERQSVAYSPKTSDDWIKLDVVVDIAVVLCLYQIRVEELNHWIVKAGANHHIILLAVVLKSVARILMLLLIHDQLVERPKAEEFKRDEFDPVACFGEYLVVVLHSLLGQVHAGIVQVAKVSDNDEQPNYQPHIKKFQHHNCLISVLMPLQKPPKKNF